MTEFLNVSLSSKFEGPQKNFKDQRHKNASTMQLKCVQQHGFNTLWYAAVMCAAASL